MKPALARVILVALAALFIVAAVTPAMAPQPPGMVAAPGANDDELFEAVIRRVHDGDGYYRAMGDELRRRQYPTASPFNWRTPTLYVALAKAPWIRPAIPIVLGVLAAAMTAVHLSRGNGTFAVVLGVVAEVGAVRAAVSPVGQLQTEAWSGLLIIISALLYAGRQWVAAAVLGLVALFVRELAAPYCVVCAALAVRSRRIRELGVWVVGAAAFAMFYARHVTEVWAHRQAGDLASPNSWVQFGGLSFLMTMLQQNNSVLLAAPHLVTAAAATLLIASLWASDIPAHVRATVAAYIVTFAIAGQSFNDYWGFVTAPLYALSFAYGLGGIRWLGARAAERSQT